MCFLRGRDIKGSADTGVAVMSIISHPETLSGGSCTDRCKTGDVH